MVTIFDLKQNVNNLILDLNNIEKVFRIEEKKKTLSSINGQLQQNWQNIQLCAELSKQKTAILNIVNDFQKLKYDIENINDILQLSEQELDSNILEECEKLSLDLKEKLKTMRIKSLFTGDTDIYNAFIEINSGAGGTESNDWAEMLMRMYLMWADRKKFAVDIIDKLDGEDAGIKTVVIKISGDYAYGLLKNETGTHRLVRISPFNANGKRQTSFAGVFCYPEVNDSIEINIKPTDLKIDVYRSSGAGGQHVNKTESAVRITHIPTGIICSCQTQRSQFQNKDNAMKMLKSKLYELELKKQNEKKQIIENSKSDISWGNQIRNYVLHPYKMVKDLRSNFEVGNASAVLNGDLDDIIESVLLYNAQHKD